MTRRAERGFILIAALWMIAALASLASAYALYAARSAPGAVLPEDRLRAEAAIRAGLELCAYRQLGWPPAARPASGAFSAEIGASRIEVAFRSEGGRVDLNAAPREWIAGLFVRLGAAPAAADFIADRVVAWRSPLKPDERRREADIYAKNGLAYAPPGAPFDNPLEISLLPGLPPALARRALAFVTVFGGAKIDPLAADPLVLSALPAATPAAVSALMALRRGPRPTAATLARAAGPLKDFVSLDPNNHVRAQIVARVAGRNVAAEIVIKINETAAAPYDILYWRDDFDGDGGAPSQ